MFVDENVHISGGIFDDVPEFLVHRRATMANFVQHRLRYHNVAQNILFKNMDLIENNVCVQHQIVRKGVHRTFGFGSK